MCLICLFRADDSTNSTRTLSPLPSPVRPQGSRTDLTKTFTVHHPLQRVENSAWQRSFFQSCLRFGLSQLWSPLCNLQIFQARWTYLWVHMIKLFENVTLVSAWLVRVCDRVWPSVWPWPLDPHPICHLAWRHGFWRHLHPGSWLVRDHTNTLCCLGNLRKQEEMGRKVRKVAKCTTGNNNWRLKTLDLSPKASPCLKVTGQ